MKRRNWDDGQWGAAFCLFPHHRSQFLVAAVAEGFADGMFATAPGDGSFLFDFGFERREARAFVRAVAEGLRFGASAGAPEIDSWFHGLDDGGFLEDNWFAHGTYYSPM